MLLLLFLEKYNLAQRPKIYNLKISLNFKKQKLSSSFISYENKLLEFSLKKNRSKIKF